VSRIRARWWGPERRSMALVGGPLILLMVILDVLVQPQTLRAAAEGYWNSVA